MHLKDSTSVKTNGRCIAQFAKNMSIDPKIIEIKAEAVYYTVGFVS